MPEIITKDEVILREDKVLDFSTAKVEDIKVMVDLDKNKLQNAFLHILVEKGAILEKGTVTSEVREPVIDQVYCFDDEKELNAFIDYIKEYNVN